MGCLFCKIVAGEIPAKVIYQDETTLAFADIDPKAPTHILVIPRKHISSIADAGDSDQQLLGHLVQVAARIANDQGLSKGFRVVINTGLEGGQTVDHLHFHILGGRFMTWPPG